MLTEAHTVQIYVDFGIGNFYKETYPKTPNLFKTKHEYREICINI
jgi:hypothetical protein